MEEKEREEQHLEKLRKKKKKTVKEKGGVGIAGSAYFPMKEMSSETQ